MQATTPSRSISSLALVLVCGLALAHGGCTTSRADKVNPNFVREPAREPVRETAVAPIDPPAPRPVAVAPVQPVRPAPAPAKPIATAKPSAPQGREAVIDLDEPSTPAKPSTTTPRPTPPGPASPTRTPPAPTKPPTTEPATAPSVAVTPPATPRPSGPAVTVGELRERAIDAIDRASKSTQSDLRANAIEAAGLAMPRLERVISAGLSDRNEGVQSVAAMTVAKNRLVSMVPKVRPLVDSRSPYVGAAAVMALSKCSEPIDDAKVAKLAELLWTSDSPRIRSHVAYVLGEIGNPSALPMLKQAAGLKMPKAASAETGLMMLQFAEAMVKLGDQAQIEPLRAALHPSRREDLETAALAAQILGELRDKRPIDQMVNLTAYQDPTTKEMYPAEVRMQIAASLAKLGLDKGGFIADKYITDPNPQLRAQAAAVYGDTGRTDHYPKLAAMLEDPDEHVRLSAAYSVLKVQRKAAENEGR
ncbi:MAG: HEAT repeat domain-containing protein [Planctomycetota bacterium]